jgi:VWFA-related protein
VQISVVVHDRKGEPVADLKKEDFTITEKGKPQTISIFSVESTGKLAAPIVKLPPHIFSNRLEHRSGVPSSVTVILLDSLNTKWQDQIYAKQQLVKFLQQIHPEDRVAIYTLGRGLKILHDYTTDSTQLLARLAKFHGQNLPDLAASEPNTGDLASSVDFVGPSQAEADFVTTNRVVNTLQTLEAIAEHLASLPGRKNLIWLSGGFPLRIGFDEIPDINGPVKEQRTFTAEMDHAIRALNNANVAMYPVDARGLVVGGDFAGAESRAPAKRATFAPIVANLDTMSELAERTGGRASYNGNDLSNAIRRAMEDAKVTYTLGYYPANENPDGKFREVKIKIDRPGVNLRYRKGYFAMRDIQQDEKSRKTQLASAAWSPLDATAVTLNARVDILDKPQPNTVNVLAQVDLSTLKLEQKNDRWVGKLDLIFVQKDEQGRQLPGGISDSLDLNLTKQTYLKMLTAGLIYRKQFPRQPKSVNLRIAVRDAGTGSTGSVSVPFSQVAN